MTLLLLIAYGVMTGIRIAHLARSMAVGGLGQDVNLGAVARFAAVLGGLSLLVAVLCTVGIFLRMRTASLAEFQLRLVALEDMPAQRGDEA